MDKYIEMAKTHDAVNALVISPGDIVFDRRAILKCLWGCEDQTEPNRIKCGSRGLTFEEAQKTIHEYHHILLIHHHDNVKLSRAARKIEQSAFLDGYYFASAMHCCHLCKDCRIDVGKPCHTPLKIRPCDQSFGIDVYQTARNLGLPCAPLQSRSEVPNRYAFVLID
ncbi:MAG: metal-binding protein [Desulfobacteraceae bacterium]|mgnify:CR=1 FL=1|nr:MAG: metal-binding protein [Desulfobacteraceae bacterium]